MYSVHCIEYIVHLYSVHCTLYAEVNRGYLLVLIYYYIYPKLTRIVNKKGFGLVWLRVREIMDSGWVMKVVDIELF